MTTDGPDANDLDRDRLSAGPSSRAGGDPRAGGLQVQLNEKLVGCGCFGCSSLIVLAGCLVLLVLVWGFLIPDWRANDRYVAGSCVVLDKRVRSEWFVVAATKGQGASKKESYRPEIKIRYEANGRKFETWCYDATENYSDDRAAQQAIADSFRVGATYPCWYDPDRPERAILVRGHRWGAYVFLVVPLGLLTIGGAGIWMARTIAASRPGPVAPGGSTPRAPAAPWPSPGPQGPGTPPGAFDPSGIGDPLAMKAEWFPLSGSGGNLQTHRLVEVDPDRLAFRATRQGLVFALVFLVVGGVATFFVVKDLVTGLSRGNLPLNHFITLPVALLFAAVGGYLLYAWTTPVVFDGRRGLFWKGWKAPDEFSDGTLPGNAASFGAIHALQLIRGSDRRDGSYELNLVLADGERLNVVLYGGGNRVRLREDAAILARFLGKPVWDAL